MMKICIFCSANDHLDPDYSRLTEELGRWIGQAGHTLVFGGTDKGLMDCVAQAARQAGARVIGMVPSKVEEGGHMSQVLDVHIPCDNLSDRKELMMAQSDVFIALPGGIGTLDEIFTVAASACIGYHSKRVILYNMKGFWDPLVSLLDDMARKGVIRGEWRQHIEVAQSLEDIKTFIK